MFFLKQLKKLMRNNHGQNTVEFCLLIAVLVLFLAAALHGILPKLAQGFMGIAAAISGPVP